MTYSEINTLARELAFLAMWLTRPTSFRSKATSSAVGTWMGDPPTRYNTFYRVLDMVNLIIYIYIYLCLAFKCAEYNALEINNYHKYDLE